MSWSTSALWRQTLFCSSTKPSRQLSISRSRRLVTKRCRFWSSHPAISSSISIHQLCASGAFVQSIQHNVDLRELLHHRFQGFDECVHQWLPLPAVARREQGVKTCRDLGTLQRELAQQRTCHLLWVLFLFVVEVEEEIRSPLLVVIMAMVEHIFQNGGAQDRLAAPGNSV